MPKAIKKKKSESLLSKHTSKHVLPVNAKRKKQRNITIGCDIFERWECAKKSLCYKSDDDFVSYLLNVVENQARSLKDGTTNFGPASDLAVNSKKILKNVKKSHGKRKLSDNHEIKPLAYNDVGYRNLDSTTVDCNSQTEELPQTKLLEENNLEESLEQNLDIVHVNNSQEPTLNTEYIENNKVNNTPSITLQNQNVSPSKTQKNYNEDPKPIPPKSTPKSSQKNKICHSCDIRHNPRSCPLFNSDNFIEDNITYDDFNNSKDELFEPSNIPSLNRNNSKENLDTNTDENDVKPKCVMTYSEASLPKILNIMENEKGLSVICKSKIRKYTKFGPMVAKLIKETDIADDSGMDDIWEIFDENKRLYFSTDDLNVSNWIRFVKAAPLREDRNAVMVLVDDKVFLVTNKDLNIGEELLYWIDDSTSLWTKKKLEKINCGGCNLKFSHVLHYRTHCSVFHDPAFSLTIRKYHCKVCGEAVLGKENIMRHAAERHDGKGAYQCQYCKKFFLRLNYLEMHRTYGCAANPQRARPLCDFCGRKFCQPQKLKVHIKRMHSDMADVLRDFQCKLCAKILGSRAALQRHNKEVHHVVNTTSVASGVGNNSTTVGNNNSSATTHDNTMTTNLTTTTALTTGEIACTRCGKTFQNKSNLKIHMLTHSGVKPFRCLSNSCNSAFTTKQCLQFHYKKVHGLTQDAMPKIERSVAYTFDAYAGAGANHNKVQNGASRDNKTLLENMPHNIENLVDIKNNTSNDSEEKHNSDNESDYELQNLSENQEDSKDNPQHHHHHHKDHRLIHETPTKHSYDSKINQDAIITNNISNQNLVSKGSKKWLGETEIHCQSDEHHNITTDIQSPIIQNFTSLHENMYNTYNQHNDMLDNQSHEDNSNIILDVVEGNSESIELDRLSIIPQNLMERHNTSDNMSLFNSHRVPSRASMLVEAALDSVSNIDITKDSSHNNTNILHNINMDSEHINIDSMEDYNINLSSDNNLDEMKLNNMNNLNRLNQYGIMSNINKMELDDINQISTNLQMSSPNLIHESEIDVSSLDSTSLRRSVETYQSQLHHQVEFSSKNSSELNRSELEQDYQMQQSDLNQSPDQTVHYAMQESDIISPVATPIPRYDFNTHNNLTNDLSSDDEGIVQNLSLNLKEKYQHLDLSGGYTNKQYGDSIQTTNTSLINQELELRNKYEIMDTTMDFRTDRNNFDPIVMSSTGELQGLDMSSRSYHNFQLSTNSTNLNRYHHLYDSLTERQTVDLSLSRSNYAPSSTNGFTSPPPPPPPPASYSDVLRVVSLDLTNSGRHNVDTMGLSRVHSSFTSQIQNNRLISDSNSRLITEHRILSAEHRLLASEHGLTTNRLLPDPVHLLLDHTSMSQNRLLSPEPHTRLLADQSARSILEQSRLLQCGGVTSADLTASRGTLVSPRGFPAYNVAPFQIGPNIGSPSNTSNTSSFHPYTGGYY